jgi:hypothetical protein
MELIDTNKRQNIIYWNPCRENRGDFKENRCQITADRIS